MTEFNRRDVLNAAAVAGVITPLAAATTAQAQTGTAPRAAGHDAAWLDGAAPAGHDGQTWGLPWPRGQHKRGTAFALSGAGADTPLQTWPIAWWPDGSIKWTAHAIPANGAAQAKLSVVAGRAAPAPQAPVTVRETAAMIEVASGPLLWRIPRSGETVIASASVAGRETLRNVRLVALSQNKADLSDAGTLTQTEFKSRVDKVTVEQTGPVRAVIKVEGQHAGGGRAWLPFTLRFYFYAGSEAVRIMHSFIFDGDEHKDFIRGLGLSGSVPLTDELHNRHIRFGGEGDGVLAEAVRGLTGLRRDPGAAYRTAQIRGQKTGPVSGMSPNVGNNLSVIPPWGDYTLTQPTADGYWLRKRTKDGHGWIDIDGGARAAGIGYVGGAEGGVAFAMDNFWKRFPVRLDIRNAHTELADFTIWLWSPEVPAMDLRFYHDGLGMDTYAKQNIGLDVTYEDYEPGWGVPHGIARTNELTLWALPATPTRQRFAQMSRNVQTPPRIQASPERLQVHGVFSDWSLPDRSTPTRKLVEDQNDYYLKFYMDQVEQRRWYGFWNHGDVMHSYDGDRHVWKYDIGGFAWDNSELSPDLWLWYSYIRSGRADVFRFAEAMTRHTREVDVYHVGRHAGFGTRHGVQHWSDSSKQPRVSNPGYARIYYYLTGGDERTGDLMRALLDADKLFATVIVGRKAGGGRPQQPKPEGIVGMGFGTDWASLASGWYTEWERTGDNKWRDKILNGMATIATARYGWSSGGGDFDTRTGRFVSTSTSFSTSHLSQVFGAFETFSEMFKVMEVPQAFRDVWIEFASLYNAPVEQIQARYGGAGAGGRNLRDGHSRGTAFAAYHRKDKALAERAWSEFGVANLNLPSREVKVAGSDVLKPIDENTRVSTNGASVWGLAAIMNLALIGDSLEAARAKAVAAGPGGQAPRPAPQ